MRFNSGKGRRAGELQRKLHISLILLLLLVTGVIVATALAKATRVRHEVFSALISQTTERAGAAVRDYLAPVDSSLRLLRRWGMSADLQEFDERELAGRFIPVLEEFSRLSGVILADDTGREVFVYRHEEKWRIRTVDAEQRPGIVERQQWDDPSGPARQWSEQLDYDPRTRPWFESATAPGQDETVHWTAPYTFVTAKQPGVTAAAAWRAAGEPGKTFVVALDVLLRQVIEHTASIAVSEHGKAFLFDSQGQPIESPGTAPRAQVSTMEAAIPQALEVWRDSPEQRTQVAPIKIGARTYWTGFQPVSARDEAFWVGVVVPAADFQAEIQSRQYWLWGVAGASLLIGGLLATLIARYYGGHLKTLERRQAPRGANEEEVRALIAQGESAHLEFKSTMRFNLKADRPGKEIELAWLKGIAAFLNAEGGMLLIGVADDGAIVGLGHDDFASDDKCLLHFNNLVGQHIGQEFARYLSPRIVTVGSEKVLLVECEPAGEPAFLKNREKEEFYVRTGPRNAKLPVSKVLKYLQTRQTAG